MEICLGLFSTIFLKRKLAWFKWTGMILVIGGLVTVGMSDVIYSKVIPWIRSPRARA